MEKKLAFNDLITEITRKCNLRCAHCLRGDAQNIDMSYEIIDALLDRTDSIGYLGITGGEPTCNLDGIEHFYNKLIENNIALNKLQIVTNGANLSERFVDLIKNYYAWISEHKGSYNNYVELLISEDKYHKEQGVDSKAALTYYSEYFKGFDHVAVGMHRVADTYVKSIGKAKDIIDPKIPKEFSDMFKAAAIPRIARIEVMASGMECLCPIRKYDKLQPDLIRILCPIEVTTSGNIISALNTFEECDNPKYKISDVWSKHILNDIEKYNDHKPYCLEYDIIHNKYQQRCYDLLYFDKIYDSPLYKSCDNVLSKSLCELGAAICGLPRKERFERAVKALSDEVHKIESEYSNSLPPDTEFEATDDEYISIYKELVDRRKDVFIENYYRKYGNMPTDELIAHALDVYQDSFVESMIEHAKEYGVNFGT